MNNIFRQNLQFRVNEKSATMDTRKNLRVFYNDNVRNAMGKISRRLQVTLINRMKATTTQFARGEK